MTGPSVSAARREPEGPGSGGAIPADVLHRAVLDSAVDFAIIVTDLEGRIVEWNVGAERVLGWSASEMRGEPVDRFFTPQDRADGRPAAEMGLALREGQAADERWHLRKDGSRFWASGELMPLRDAAGAHIGFLKILRDRTEAREAGVALMEAQERLRESEDHFRHTVELNPQVPWTCDPQGNITSYSQRWLDLTGQAPGEPDGAGWIEVLHPDDVAPTVSVFSACLASGEPVDVDYRIRVAATGAYRWARARAHPRRDADGAITRWYGVVEDVHDKKLADERLRASEERYRALFDTLEAGFCIVEMRFDDALVPLDYRIVEANPAFERQTGLVGAHGRWISELVPDLERNWFEIYGRVALTGEPVRFENGASPMDRRWFDVFAYRTGAPEARRVAVFFNDISDRRRIELALRDSEEQFRVFAQAVPNHVWAARPDGYLYWFNQQAYAYGGGQPGSMDGTSAWGQAVHPDDLPAAGAAWGRSLATGAVYETEFRIRRADGAYRWFLVRAEPVRDADGRITHWVGTNTDIDDRRRQAAELAHLNATLEQRVEERTRERDRTWSVSQDMMVVVDAAGTFRAVSPAATRILGWETGEMLGRTVFEFTHPDDVAMGACALGEATGAELTRVEGRYRHKDGSYRWLAWTAAPEGDLVYATGRHVTAEKEQSEALLRIEEQLRQSQKMEAVGQLTGGLAHDFNNLLAGISGSLELLQTRMGQGRLSDLDRYITAAQGASKRAAALTHRLLAFSRRQTLDPKPTNVNGLVAGMEELIRRTVGPAVHVEVVGASGLWPALVDPPQLENALLNLCINARDAMPDGGRITIETANTRLDERAARERDLAPGQYLSLRVSDTGTGMPPDVVARAFDPFFTTKPIGQGTGLGLSMIYGFARQSGGQVRIQSGLGEGTTMCLYLPRHHGEAERADAMAPLGDVPRAERGQTVLVVDDEPTVRMLVTEVLEDLGYTAIEAADGPAGLKVLRSDVRVDLLVTDVGLPGGMNGRQMADAGRVVRPGLRVLFITGYAENAAVGDGHLDPGMSVLTKPFVMEALAARIRELIAG